MRARRPPLHLWLRAIAIAMAVQLVPAARDNSRSAVAPRSCHLAGAEPDAGAWRAAAERRPRRPSVWALGVGGGCLSGVRSQPSGLLGRRRPDRGARHRHGRPAARGDLPRAGRDRPGTNVLAVEASQRRGAAIRAVRQPGSFRHLGRDGRADVCRVSAGARLRAPASHPRDPPRPTWHTRGAAD